MIEDFDEGFYDAHLFMYNPSAGSECLYASAVSSRNIKDSVVSLDKADSRDWSSYKYIFTAANGRFTVWS
jgi:hypothetical protein